MELSIGKPFLFIPRVKEVWEAVWDTYSNLENPSQIFNLKTRLWQVKQRNRDVIAYYNEKVTLWQELDHEEWENPEDSARHLKREEDERVYMFLAGLNRELDDVRGRILSKKPLPNIREVFLKVRRGEARQRVMMNKPENVSDIENSALES